MEGLLFEVLNMSISASWLILAVILIRFLLEKAKAPKGIRYVLWALVAIRLLCPITIESGLSLVPSAETFSEEVLYGENPTINSGVEAVDNAINPMFSEGLSPEENPDSVIGENSDEAESVGVVDGADGVLNEDNPIQIFMDGAAFVWGLGVIVMLVYTLKSYLRLRNTVDVSIHLRDNLWICDEIQSPFILGLLNSRIYLPSHIDEEQIPYIVAHENEHLKYHDNWWKPLGFGILAIHWFNPLVWVAYILMCRDIELACDERVIRHMNNEEKKKYSESLLLCSRPRHLISACPVAFGEIGIKERIKSVVNYKKPATWIVGIGVVLCVVVAVCFLTNPFAESDEDYTEYVIHETKAYVTRGENKDLIQTVLYSKDDDKDYENEDNYIKIKVFQGDERGFYEDEPIYVSREYGISEERNGTIGITTKDGMDYFYGIDVAEIGEEVTYSYSIFYIKDGELEVVDKQVAKFVKITEDTADFTVTMWHDVVPQFKESLENWLVSNTLLISFDEDVNISDENHSLWADLYLNDLWGRHEVYDYDDESVGAIVEIPNGTDNNIIGGIDYMVWEERSWDEIAALYPHYPNVQKIERDFNSEEADISKWFEEYNGNSLQIIKSPDSVDESHSVTGRSETVFYRSDENDVQKVLHEMLTAMIDPLMEENEGRYYTITRYELDEEQPLKQINENVWMLEIISGYYAYEGTDMGTMEEVMQHEEVKDGMIPFMAQGSSNIFQWILIKEGDVYRLQLAHDMGYGIEY